MGANSSTLIDDLHASVQVADEVATKRKLGALKAVQEYGQDPAIAVQIIEQGGMQPLLRCYNASHPHVRIEAAKALAVLAQQPSNQMEMGADEVLPQYHPALLTASLEFREHAMALLAALATPEVNRIKIAHEGLVAPVLEAMTAPRETLQLHALDALAKLCAVRQIAVLATQRGALPRLLRAARSPVAAVKLAVVRVLCGIASCAENMSAFISSGAVIFLMGCTYCGADLQLEVARCLEGLLQQVYEGSSELSEREAYMLAVMSAVEVNPERISDDSAMVRAQRRGASAARPRGARAPEERAPQRSARPRGARADRRGARADRRGARADRLPEAPASGAEGMARAERSWRTACVGRMHWARARSWPHSHAPAATAWVRSHVASRYV